MIRVYAGDYRLVTKHETIHQPNSCGGTTAWFLVNVCFKLVPIDDIALSS